MMAEERPSVEVGNGTNGRSGDAGDLTHHDARGLVVVALVPPEAALDPPPVLPLIVEQRAASAAHVVFEFYLGVLLHTHLDCARGTLVPGTNGISGLFRLEVERNTVHTVPQARWPGTILEDMAEVSFAPGAMHLGARHPQRAIGRGLDRFG